MLDKQKLWSYYLIGEFIEYYVDKLLDIIEMNLWVQEKKKDNDSEVISKIIIHFISFCKDTVWCKDDEFPLFMFSFVRQVFGLGNKTYEHYNAMGKYVDKRLAELGATRVFELGMGDDDANMEDDFITWKDAMWPKVKMVDLYEYSAVI